VPTSGTDQWRNQHPCPTAATSGLEFALAKGGFSDNPAHKRTAIALVKELKGNKSVGGRHQVLTTLLKKGVTLSDMIKATGSSRRTIFRYLNHFEEAGMNINLENGRYRLKSDG
jgi:hypothetical protein